VTIVTRETIDDRWLTLTIGPAEQGREGSSDLHDRLTNAVAELAIRMVHGLRDTGQEDDQLIALTFRVEQFVERAVKDYAFEIETIRMVAADRRTGLTRAVS
jgi:hypothetical protein